MNALPTVPRPRPAAASTRSARTRAARRLCAACAPLVWLLVLGASLAGSATAHAQPAPLTQPEVVPRTVAVVYPFRAYADPALPAEQTGLRALSLADVRRDVSRFFEADPRYQPVDFVARMLEVERSDAQQDLLFIAQQSARLGKEHYRSFNLASAASELAAAKETYDRTLRAWSHPAEVGDALFDLALVELERASADAEHAPTHEARARAAFEQLFRVDPARRIDGAVAPPRVVAAWHEAAYGQLLDGAEALHMRRSEAEHLADMLGVDVVVWAFVATDAEGTHVGLQLYDHVSGRFATSDAFPAQPERAVVSESVERRLSVVAACQELVRPPEDPGPREAGRFYLDLSYVSATFLERPTDRLFYTRGARVGFSAMLRDTFGLHLSLAHLNAAPDRDGQLLGSVDTTSVSAGILAGGRVGRVRLHGLAAFEGARMGRVRATDDFWCKVSEGEPVVFDETRECSASDVVENKAEPQLGVTFGLTTDVQVVGPFWVHLLIGSTVTIAPFEDRAVGSPVFGDVGFAYRF